MFSAYLIGSIPTAYLFARLLKGVDIREHGSGNVGATNVFRVVGKKQGIFVLLIDFLKGFLPVALFPLIFNIDKSIIKPEIFSMIIGICAISGHIWPVFLKFKGGKGVATTAGALLAFIPDIFFIGLIVWCIFFIIFRYVSIASIAASLSLPIASIALNKPLIIVLFCIVLFSLGTFKHRSNIARLIQGTEKKLL